MIQLHECPLLYPRDIASRDPQLHPLFPAGIQAKPLNHNFLLPVIQDAQIAVNLALLDLKINFHNDVICVGT